MFVLLRPTSPVAVCGEGEYSARGPVSRRRCQGCAWFVESSVAESGGLRCLCRLQVRSGESSLQSEVLSLSLSFFKSHRALSGCSLVRLTPSSSSEITLRCVVCFPCMFHGCTDFLFQLRCCRCRLQPGLFHSWRRCDITT